MEPTQLIASRATVLVVDDCPAMLKYLRLLLESDSYVVETASTGTEAVHRLQTGSVPDVVLLDMQMPGLNGLKTLRRLRRLRPDLKVIMCSGVDDPRQIEQASLMGAYSYLTKPVQHLYLSAALEQCLGLEAAKARAISNPNLVSFDSVRYQ